MKYIVKHARTSLVLVTVGTLIAVTPACVAAPAGLADTGSNDVTEGDPNAPAAASTPKAGTTKPTGDAAAQGDPNACPYDGPPIDVSGFATCLDGGRCVPSGVVPADQRARLAACPGGFCVAEKIIKAHGVLLPKSCRSVFGAEGRCESTVFPELAAQKDNLPVDVCDANERCAPCFDPQGKETGVCRTVPCDAPKEPAKTFAKCCTSNGKSRGTCLTKASLPTVAASGLEQKECPSTGDLCVPDETLDPAFKGPTCKGSSLLGTYDGACVSDCIKMDFLTQLGTSVGNCSAGHICAPCKNPLTGAATGTPGCPP